MSEYQYYEFQAIDRPLDKAAQRALRQISSRGTITAHSFVNGYQWGDFKGDPRRLMEQWFDLFIYWANWGTRTVMLRVPRRYVDPKAIKAYALETVLDVWSAGDFTLVCFNRAPEEAPDTYLEDEAGLATPLRALRADMLRGDLRVYYLGWLIGVQDGEVDDDSPEPPRPAGLGSLSGPLKSFAEFFDLDQDLLDAAAEGDAGAGRTTAEPSEKELESFIEALPDKEKTDLLRRAVLENDPHVRLDIGRRWAEANGASSPVATPDKQPRRTARDLRAAAEAHAGERGRREAKREADERARRDRQARRELDVRLDKLKPRAELAWREVETFAESKRPKEYDLALALLKDLAHLADREGERAAFDRRFGEFRSRHQRKSTFLARLDAAGLKGT